LLLETGLDRLCDALIYVACPARKRRRRAHENRGWSAAEHRAREARQWSLRKKRARADYIVDNGFTPEQSRRDVRAALRAIEGK
jgi:dephospho-CoA kinase